LTTAPAEAAQDPTPEEKGEATTAEIQGAGTRGEAAKEIARETDTKEDQPLAMFVCCAEKLATGIVFWHQTAYF